VVEALNGTSSGEITYANGGIHPEIRAENTANMTLNRSYIQGNML
jgi:hypothetical protein